MLNQILTHTPVYVWGILTFLVYRGVIAMRPREVAVKKLFIIPLVMLALSVQDVVAKFGITGVPLAAWSGAAVAMTLLVAKLGASGIGAGRTPGSVLVPGSAAPLAVMMAIFVTKYAIAVTLAVAPQVRQSMSFTAVVCMLLGVFSGYFLGRLVGDLLAWEALRGKAQHSGLAVSAL